MELSFFEKCFSNFEKTGENHMQDAKKEVKTQIVPTQSEVLTQQEIMTSINEIFYDANVQKLMHNSRYNNRMSWVIIGNLQLEYEIPIERSIIALREYISQNGYPIIMGGLNLNV